MTDATHNNDSPRSVTILGGGLAGLSAAQKFSQAGWEVTVVEQEPVVGGLARSFVSDDGYTCDLGPHRLYSNLEELNDHFRWLLDGNYHERDRLSRIFMKNRFFNYPLNVKNVLTSLSPWLLFRSFWDYAAVRLRNAIRPIPDDNFENWIVKRFGRTLYDLFFGTYTRKAWGIPCTEISADWAAQRISQLNLIDTVKKTLFRPKGDVRSLVSKFIYPKHGGIGQLSEGYRRRIEADGNRVLTEVTVTGVRASAGKVTAIDCEQNGEALRLESDLYVSTIPLTALVRIIDDVPDEVIGAADGLRQKGIVFAYLKLDRERVSPDHWVYIPEEHIAIHRISEFTNFSDTAAPSGRTLVCAEITATKGDHYWTMDDADVLELAARNLADLGLIKQEEVLPDGIVTRIDYAYPIYDLTYRGHVRTLIDYLKTFDNMVSTGRQGLFRYGNMDHSIAMGHAVARRILERQNIDHAAIAADEEYFG